MTPQRLVMVVTDSVTAKHLMVGQLAALARSGLEVTVVSSPGRDLEATARREGVATCPVPMTRGFSPGRDLLALSRLTMLFGRIRPTIVNAGTPKAGLLGTLAARLVRVPVRVYTLRGLRLETTTGAARKVLSATERIAAASAQRVVCVSESVRSRFVELGLALPRKCIVLGAGSSNGVDTDRFRPRNEAERRATRLDLGIEPAAPVVGFVGRFTRDKGIAELLAAFDLVVERAPGSRLLVLGDFEEGDPVAPEVRRRLESDPRIVRPGFVADTSAFYSAMDVLAFPSYREGFPNAPLEAAASGLPVVGFAATGTVDAVLDGETGLLVPVGDASALGASLGRYLGDEDLRRAHGAAGRARAEREFRCELVWARWLELYRAMLGAVMGGSQRHGESWR